MAATPSIKVVKSFQRRGGTVSWSNRYHLNGGTVASSGAFTTLANAVVAAEKASLFSDTTIINCVYYAAGSDVPVYTTSHSVAGTLVGTNTQEATSDSCALMRYSTTARTSKNHPIYLFNYVHGVRIANGAQGDVIVPLQKTALGVYGASWLSGFSDGTNTYVRAGPNGATATGVLVNDWIHHRDFPS